MRFKFLLCFIALLGYASLCAQSTKIEFEEFTLDNGLHVILYQDNSTPIVTVSVMYHVGSKNEKENRTGFAHFFEHLLFEGSENVGRGEYAKIVQHAGGQLNANTTNDRTYYFETVPSNQLELGLWLESERMLHARVDIEGVETQREVVKEERRQRIDNQPYGSVLEETFKRAYKVHPYKWPVIGYMEDLNAATESDYIEFYKTFYVPNNAILSIAGDINPKQAKEWVKKYFGTIPKGTKEIYRPDVEEPALGGEVRDTVYDNIQLPAVVQTYRIPAQGTDDYYAVDMLSRLMSGGESARLYRSLVDEQQKAVFVGSFPFQMEDPGVTIAFGVANQGVSTQDVEDAMDAEFEKVQKELIPEKEFEKLRNQIESDFISQNSTGAGIAENLANYKMYFGDTNLINTEIERYMAVSREDIRKAAQKYFNKNNRVVLHYLPNPVKP